MDESVQQKLIASTQGKKSFRDARNREGEADQEDRERLVHLVNEQVRLRFDLVVRVTSNKLLLSLMNIEKYLMVYTVRVRITLGV